MFEALYAEMCAAALDATVAVMDDCTLEELVSVAVKQVMHNVVAEVGGKYLAHLGVVDDEARGGQRLICPAYQLIPECDKILFETVLKLYLIGLAALVPPRVLVCAEQVQKQLSSFRTRAHRCWQTNSYPGSRYSKCSSPKT